MPRTKNVTVAGKEYVVQERRIGELKQLVADLFPGSGGKLSEVDPTKLFDLEIDDVLYTKLPELFPGLTPRILIAYMSELKLSSRRLWTSIFRPESLGLPDESGATGATQARAQTPTSRQGGTTRKR